MKSIHLRIAVFAPSTSLRREWIVCVENASLVRALLTRLRCRLAGVHVTLVHYFEYWVLRFRAEQPLPPASLSELEALIREFGGRFAMPARLARVFAWLDDGHAPVEVMREARVPVVACGRVDFERFEAFCSSLVRSLGYLPPSLV